MKNEHIVSLLSDYIEGTLSSTEHERVKTHLIFCNTCREHLHDLEQNRTKLKNLSMVPPPPGLEDRIMKTLLNMDKEAPAADPVSRPTAWGRIFSWQGAAILAMGAFTIMIVRYIPQEMPAPKMKQRGVDQIHDLKSRGYAEKKIQSSGGGIEPLEEKSIREEAFDKPKEIKNAITPLKPEPAVRLRESDAVSELLRGGGADGGVGVEAKQIPIKEYAPSAPITGEKVVVNLGREMNLKKVPLDSSALDSRQKGAISPLSKPITKQDILRSDNLGKSASLAQPLMKDEDVLQGAIDIRGQSSAIREPWTTHVTNQETWRRLWSQHAGPGENAPSLPVVDFEKNDVIAIFLGERASAGYDIHLLEIEDTTWEGKPSKIVEYQEVAPNPRAYYAATMTQPYLIKIVPKIQGKVFFRKIP